MMCLWVWLIWLDLSANLYSYYFGKNALFASKSKRIGMNEYMWALCFLIYACLVVFPCGVCVRAYPVRTVPSMAMRVVAKI